MSIVVMIQNNFWKKTAHFSPLDLSNLNQWYNPSDITASVITYWNDGSGNSHRLITAVGTVTTSSLNGYNVVVVGSNAAMSAQENYSTIFSQPNQTIFLVVKPQYGTIFGDYGNTLNKILIFNVNNQNGNTMRFYARDGAENIIQITNISIPNGKTGFNIYGLVLDGTNKTLIAYDHTGSSYSATNTLYDPTTTFEGVYPPYSYQTWFGLGNNSNYNQTTGYGQIAEIIIYQETKSLSEINQLGNYLATKYGLSWTNF